MIQLSPRAIQRAGRRTPTTSFHNLRMNTLATSATMSSVTSKRHDFDAALEVPLDSRARSQMQAQLRAQFIAWFRSHPEPSSSNSYETELAALLIRAEEIHSETKSCR